MTRYAIVTDGLFPPHKTDFLTWGDVYGDGPNQEAVALFDTREQCRDALRLMLERDPSLGVFTIAVLEDQHYG